MSDIDPPKDESQKEKNENQSKDEKKEKEISEEKKEEIKEEEKKENEKEEEKKEEEDEKSEEEKEKSESSKDSDNESEESKNSKESKESKESNDEDKKSKDKKEKDEEENEEDDDDDDDLDDDVDDEGNSDESSSENKQKDPYHGYMNSKTEYKNFANNIKKNDYVYGFKQNKFYKVIEMKNIANDKRSQIFKFELKEIKNNKEGGKKINVKLAKNIQYMASIYGKAQEEEKDIKEKEKDIKEKDKKENKKDKEEKNSENDKKKESLNKPEENKEKNIEKESKSDKKDKKTEKKDNIVEEEKKDNIEENKNKIEENKESENKEKENKEENKEENKDKEKQKDKKEKEKENKKKNNKKKVKNLNLFTVIKDLTEYTFFQKIRVIYLNPLNNPVVFYLKININTSIKEIIEQFSDLYHYEHERYSDKIPLYIFINGKKHSISNRTEAKYFIPTKFDYKNDYILILEKQTFKLKELDVSSRTNYMNLKGVDVVHAVYNALYNYEIDSFLITKGITSLDCQVYELKKELNIRQFTDNEHTIKQKLREFLDSNWKEKTNFVTTFKSIKVKNSKSYNCNLFEISRKFTLIGGKIYVFVIKSNNKKIDIFNGRRIYTDGIYIVSKNNKSILDGFKAKAISDFTANS